MMNASVAGRVLMVVALGLSAACATADGAEAENKEDAVTAASWDSGPELSGACASEAHVQNADGDAVLRCDKPFAEAPFVRLPSDEIVEGGVSTLYVTYNYTRRFQDRNGVEYAHMDANGQGFDSLADAEGAFPKSLRLPSNRNMYTVYVVRARIGTVQGKYDPSPKAALSIVAGAPAVVLPAKVIDDGGTGVWEGDTSARVATRKFDENDRVPLRIRIEHMRPKGVAPEWDTDDVKLQDGELFELVGAIENFDRSVKGSDGKCYPSLTGLGERNPFYGASKGTMTIHRDPHMHKLGDQVTVLVLPEGASDWSPTAMDMLGVFSPAAFISPTKLGPMEFHPHGLPVGNDIRIAPIPNAGATEGC